MKSFFFFAVVFQSVLSVDVAYFMQEVMLLCCGTNSACLWVVVGGCGFVFLGVLFAFKITPNTIKKTESNTPIGTIYCDEAVEFLSIYPHRLMRVPVSAFGEGARLEMSNRFNQN